MWHEIHLHIYTVFLIDSKAMKANKNIMNDNETVSHMNVIEIGALFLPKR